MILQMTTPELLAQWATWQRAQGCAESTISARATRVRIMERHSRVPAAEVEVDQLLAYIAVVPSTSTKSTYYSHLRAWFRWLVQAGHRLDDPTQRVKAPRPPRRQPHPTPDEHLAHLLIADRMYHRTKVMILLAAVQGLRVHEIAKLRGQDVDLIGKVLTVTGKGGVTAQLPLHQLIADEAAAMPRRGYWFPARSGREGHVHARSVTDVIRYAMRRVGVPGSAHSLRHWYGTTLVDDGGDLRTAQTLLRHASLATTQIYTQVADRSQRAAIDRLDPLRGRRLHAA